MLASVVINEILASSSGRYIQDEDGDDSDYIELYNSSASAVDLTGWYLTDNSSQLTKWQLPALELDAGGYLVIFASNKNRTDPSGELHTNFALSAEGEFLALVQADGTTIENALAPQYPQQYSDSSYGLADIYEDDVYIGKELRYFDVPTPGAENGIGLLGFVNAVTLSHSHGFYSDSFLLTLQTTTPGAQIYYTYDGSIPQPGNASAILYAGPVEINRTTIVRAAATKEEFGLSPVTTQSYIFVEDVIGQTIDRFNPANNPFGLNYAATWQGVAADYNMDPAVVAAWNDNNPDNDDFGIREALLALPSMSLVMDHEDLWDSTIGIYTNAHKDGDDWRRPGSIEYINPAGGAEFSYNVGVQIHGRGSRGSDQPKHSLRLIFNPEFDGPGRLNFPLFDQSNFSDINTVVLKGMNQDNFAVKTVTDAFSSYTATNMRDQWMDDTFRAMGNVAPEYTYVHLYVNGLYWGLYQAVERMDDASVPSRLGGEEEDWDVIRPNGEYWGSNEAWNAMFALARTIPSNSVTTANAIYHQLQGLNPDGTRNEALPVYLDMDNLIDYVMLHYYAGANEWVGQFVAARNREDPGTGFKFFVWDQDVTFGYAFGGRIQTSATGTSSAQELKFYLQRSPEFRLRFADRAQKHLFNNGALSDEQALTRWQGLADHIAASIVADSARWGDAKKGKSVKLQTGGPTIVLPTITIDQWRSAVEHVKAYSLESHSRIIGLLKNNGGLFTSLWPPLVNQFGGTVANGFAMTLAKQADTPAAAKIYYTLDGSDPRLLGNVLNPAAIEYTGPVTLGSNAHLRARVVNGTTWSAEINTEFNVLAQRNPGDYDDNQVVELEDEGVWNAAFGDVVSPGTSADGTGDGVVDAADYVVWRRFYIPSPPGPDTDYDFVSIGQTYTQNFNDFRGTEETLPQYFSSTIAAGTDPFRGVFNSTSHSPNMFTGIKAATTDGTDHSLAWRENTGQAGMEDARFLFKIKNDTGQAINGFFVSYDVEAWVNGRRDNRVRFKYDIYADSDEAQAAEGRNAFESDIFSTTNPNHTEILINGDQFVLNGKAAGNYETVSGYVDLTTLLISDAQPGLGYYGSLAPGETAYFRWQISNGTNILLQEGNRSALGIDNISITALTGPPGGGGSASADLVGSESLDDPFEHERVGAFDVALADWFHPTTSVASVARGSQSISSSTSLVSDDMLLLALQRRVDQSQASREAFEQDDFGLESGESSSELDEFFAELDCSPF